MITSKHKHHDAKLASVLPRAAVYRQASLSDLVLIEYLKCSLLLLCSQLRAASRVV